MKQHSTPISIIKNKAEKLEKIDLKSSEYNEAWLQYLAYTYPNLIPVEEIEQIFTGMVPICRELPTDSGPADLIYINEFGYITIAECKLWRNPEARRKVIGQILDYAKDIAKWDYSKLETTCLKKRNDNSQSLIEIMQSYYPDIDEVTFIDNIQNSLKKGSFLLLIIGDGIRENMEDLIEYVQGNGFLNFTLSLIEMPLYKKNNGEIVITPRILVKTKELERTIYRIKDEYTDVIQQDKEPKNKSTSITETVFYERLMSSIGKETTNELQEFIDLLKNQAGITTKLGRGKILSLNIKSSIDTYNFASIQETGEVWFYGIVNKTEEAGDKQIAIDYLKNLAELLNADFDTNYKEWYWCVKRADKYLQINEYLSNKENWMKLIMETLKKIQELEENL